MTIKIVVEIIAVTANVLVIVDLAARMVDVYKKTDPRLGLFGRFRRFFKLWTERNKEKKQKSK